MPDYPATAEMTDAQKLAFLHELPLDVSSAMQDLQAGVQRLYEKSRRVDLETVTTIGE